MQKKQVAQAIYTKKGGKNAHRKRPTVHTPVPDVHNTRRRTPRCTARGPATPHASHRHPPRCTAECQSYIPTRPLSSALALHPGTNGKASAGQGNVSG